MSATVSNSLDTAVDNLLVATKHLSETLVGRDNEIQALLYSVLTKSHVMLDGPPGTAKSMLARAFFSIFSGIKSHEVFCLQFTKNTAEDKLFGPVDIELLRKESTWKLNTARMLPEARFAFLDEVYRGSDSLLPSTFSVLNERVFFNGSEVVHCPLITAVGTTNFVTDSEELEAFHDRWLIKVKVAPLENQADRLSMYDKMLQKGIAQSTVIQFPVDALERLQGLVLKMKMTEDLLKLYDDMLVAMLREAPAKKIHLHLTDRRKCEMLRLIQAAAVLRKSTEVAPEDLYAARFGIYNVGDSTAESVFSGVFQRIVTAYAESNKDRQLLNRLGRVSQKLEEEYDDDMSKDAKEKLFLEASRFRDLLSKTPRQFSSQDANKRFNDITNQTERVIAFCKGDETAKKKKADLDDLIQSSLPQSNNDLIQSSLPQSNNDDQDDSDLQDEPL